jgi:hypothetical protein
MSHLTKVKTKIKNYVILKQALSDLNIKYVESSENNELVVKGYNKEHEKVQMLLKTGGPYDIGVVHNVAEDTYEFIADWWGVENYVEMTQEDYINKITQRYAYNNVMDKIKSKGYDVVNENTDEKENIRIVLRKWD